MSNDHQTKAGIRFVTSYNPETICSLPVLEKIDKLHLRIDLPNIRGLTKTSGSGKLNFKPIQWQILVRDSLGNEQWETLSPGIQTKNEFNLYMDSIERKESQE